ncbi:HPr family phosphocarrier protein [Thermomicrobium sp.]
MERAIFRLVNRSGLHARPAALFVQTAARYRSAIRVRSLTRDTSYVDAKSILGVLGLGAECGHEIEVAVEGEDEREALAALKQLFEQTLAQEETT